MVVIWDTTPQAWRAWRNERSAEYADAVNASLENPLGASKWAALSDVVEEAVGDTEIPESEAPSMSLHLDVKTRKKASGKGPYPATRRGGWKGCSRTREENDGLEDDVEVEGRRDGPQAALLRENSRPERVRAMDCAQTLCAARLESAGSEATRAMVVPGE